MTDHLTYSLPVPGPVKGCTRPQGQARDMYLLVHQPPAYEALTNQGDAPVSVYIDHVAYFNRTTVTIPTSIEYYTYYVPRNTTPLCHLSDTNRYFIILN